MTNQEFSKSAVLKPYARKLRGEMTPEERKLWYDCLKKLPFTIKRQKIIGPYIVDFYCAEAKLVIEVDGLQHLTETGVENDYQRDRYLSEQGFKVLRIPNEKVKRAFPDVCREITICIEDAVRKE